MTTRPTIFADQSSSLFTMPPSLFEKVFFILAMSIYIAEAFLVGGQPRGAEALNPVKALEAMSAQGDTTKQLLLMVVYLAVTAVMLRCTPWKTLFFLGAPLMLLYGWCLLSTVWSIDPGITIRRDVALLGTVAIGTYMGLRFDIKTLLRLMSWVTAVVLISSVVVAVLWPDSGLDFEGRLRGVMPHKNEISSYAQAAFLMLAAQLFLTRNRHWLVTICDGTLAVLAIVCMVWSESASAIPVLLLALPLLPLPRVLRAVDRSVTALIPLLLGLFIAAAFVLVDNSDTFTKMLGKSADMSGRTWVWAYSIKMFFENPWLGYGFSTFWQGFNSPGGVFWSLTGWGIPHSHNGYIQLALDAGTVGLVLFMTALGTVVFKLAWLIQHGNDPLIGWAVAFLGLVLVSNLSETTLWVTNQLFTELFVYVVVYANFSVWKTLCAFNRRRPSGPVYHWDTVDRVVDADHLTVPPS